MLTRFNKDTIPAELIEQGRFCCWRYEDRNNRKTKCPYNPRTGGGAMSNNPDTFADFQTAQNALNSGKYDGLGVGIFPPFAAVDIDHCIDESGKFSEMAADIIDTMHSYSEVSPSGTGIRIFFLVKDGFLYDKGKFYIMNRENGLEIYVSGSTSKFCTITGNRVNDFPLSDGTEGLMLVLEKYMQRKTGIPAKAETNEFQHDLLPHCLTAADVIQRAQLARNGDKFLRLFHGDISGYPSHSEADAGLCNILAFYTEDETVIDEIFRRSGLMRDKWDRVRSGSTYGKITIENAIAFNRQCGICSSGFNEVKRGGYNVEKSLHIDAELLERLSRLNPQSYHFSDKGMAELFADCFRHCLRYNVTLGDWMHFNGIRWEQDMRGMKALGAAKDFFDALMHFASGIEDEQQQKLFRDFYSRLGSKCKRDILLKDAADRMYICTDDMDTNSNFLNFQNGTFELDSMTFREHRPEDFITKVCSCEYRPECSSEEWERFTRQVIPNDLDKLEFLQKAIGHSLLGQPLECFFILYGRTTRNGKSTFLETIGAALGDYARGAEPETLAHRRNRDSRAPSEDLARLQGCRFLRVSEPPANMIFDVALLKKLTGGDAITARFLNQGSFEFVPQFTLFMNTNFLPRVLDETLFSSGRVRVIEFQKHFGEHEQDTNLKIRLRSPENLSGVMNWALRGLQLYREQGFEIPHTVEIETSDYQRISDKLNDFIDERLVPSEGNLLTANEVYVQYVEWCSSCGYSSEGKQRFFDKLRTRGMLADSGTINGKTVRNVVKGFSFYKDFGEISS